MAPVTGRLKEARNFITSTAPHYRIDPVFSRIFQVLLHIKLRVSPSSNTCQTIFKVYRLYRHEAHLDYVLQ